MATSAYSFEAIGTKWHIALETAEGSTDTEELLDRVRARIAVFDAHYSRFRDDSLVSQMSRVAGTYELPEDARPMLDLYRDLYVLTEGVMTPLIGSVLVAAGYDARYSLQPKELHKPPIWDETLVYEYPYLTLKQPALLDFGAAGKGYLVDIVANILKGAGALSFLIDAGGDMYSYSKAGTEVRIGLENPWDTKQVIGVASIVNKSICGSAGNRRTWAQFHHIIHPETLASPQDIAAVWVVADTALLADALTTALYLVPAALLKQRYTFEYLTLFADRTTLQSENFPAVLFTTQTL